MTALRGNLKVLLEGRGLVSLRSGDHVATGGEGAIYRVGKDTVVKLYTDPSKMKQFGIPEKIRKLALLKHKYVVAPSGLVFSEKKSPLGLHMPYIEGHPLPRVFTNDFYKQEGFTSKHAAILVDRMRETVMFAHQKGAILVDANELNWFMLFGKKDPEPRVVDVDSWAIERWPATAVMPSIRDWNSKSFNQESDWFSWGIVTFQVFTGLHPYKGTLDKFKKNDFIERMKANASVFTQGVRLNQAVRDFSLIPSHLLDWYEAVFQKGERTIPPSPFDLSNKTPQAAKILRIKVTKKSGLLIYDKLFERVSDPVRRVFHCGVALLESGILIELRTKKEIGKVDSSESVVVKVDGGWLVAERNNSLAIFSFIREGHVAKEKLSFESTSTKLLTYDNRIFIVNEQGLTEIRVHNFGNKVVASVGQTWTALVNSATWFDTLGVEDAMGAMFVILPKGEKDVAHIKVKEIDGLKVVMAKSGNRYAAFVGINKKGEYQRVELVFNSDYSSYSSTTAIVDQPDLNIAILPKGVYALINEDGEINIAVPTTGAITKIEDELLFTDMLLTNWEDKVLYLQNKAVWSLRMT
jgi:hypothetical protein